MRQRRDKGPAKVDTSDADHGAIPRDAEGNPIFLILPELMRANYQKAMARCEAAWHEGEPLAVAEAATWAHAYRQVMPKWLEQAVVELAIGRRGKQQAKSYSEPQIRLQRYMTVRDRKVSNFPERYLPWPRMSWEEAYERAAELLAGTEAAGTAATMKADYCRVQRDLNAGHSGKYFNLKDWRYRLNGEPDPNGPAKVPSEHSGIARK